MDQIYAVDLPWLANLRKISLNSALLPDASAIFTLSVLRRVNKLGKALELTLVLNDALIF